MFSVFLSIFIIPQVIPSFWLVLGCDLLEDRHTTDVIITKFFLCVFKWWKVFRIQIIFYVTGQNLRYKKVLPRRWTGSTSKKKDKAFRFRKLSRKYSRAVSVGSQASLNQAQNCSWLAENHCIILNLTNPMNKMFQR